MKFSKLVVTILLMIVFFCFITSCKNSTEPDVDYLDLQWIWLGGIEPYEQSNGEVVRHAWVYYRGNEPDVPSSFYDGGVDLVTTKFGWDCNCKWVHYYKDDGYIEYEEIGEDYRVKYVVTGEDLRVKYVIAGANSQGKWEIVDVGEDYKIRIVSFGEDFKVKEVITGQGCR